MKIYEKPDLEYISLIAMESIADGVVDGSGNITDVPDDEDYWD